MCLAGVVSQTAVAAAAAAAEPLAACSAAIRTQQWRNQSAWLNVSGCPAGLPSAAVSANNGLWRAGASVCCQGM
jgi:hypothetical protein